MILKLVNKMEKIQVHIRLPQPIVNMIDVVVDGDNLTNKVENYIMSMYLTKEWLVNEKTMLEAKLKCVDEQLKDNLFFTKESITEAEKQFLIETMDMLSKKPEIIYGRTSLFNGRFGRHLTVKDFKLLLFEFKEELEQKR